MTSRARTPQPSGDGTPVDYYAPTAEYAQRPPSPPFIHIPSRNTAIDRMQLAAPTDFDGVDIGNLTPRELALVTGSGRMQRGFVTEQWHYELRRQAQPILDFIFLGPSSVARDVEFLRNNGITMVLGARDARLAAVRLNKIDQECAKLGIKVGYIDVGSPGALIKSFSDSAKIINQHLVEVYRAQIDNGAARAANGGVGVDGSQAGTDEGGGMDVDAQEPQHIRRGKVLVFCETGNDRSAAVVAAYIMAVFRVDMVTAVQYVQGSRFCTCFDEETKQMLATYEGLLQARRQIAQSTPSPAAAPQVQADAPQTQTQTQKHQKRGLVDTMDEEDMAMMDMGGSGDMDRERYVGRNFAPFMDSKP